MTGGERAPAGEEGEPTGGEEEPRGGLPDLQSSPAYLPQTSLQGTLGDLNPLVPNVGYLTCGVGPLKRP